MGGEVTNCESCGAEIEYGFCDSCEQENADQSDIWYLGLLVSVALFLCGVSLLTIPDEPPETAFWVFFLVTTTLMLLSMYKDTRRVARSHGWPRFRGLHYLVPGVVPLVNFPILVVYLVNRMEVIHFGYPVFSLGRIGKGLRNPLGLVKGAYVTLGVLVAVAVPFVVLVLYPASALFSDESPLATLVVLLFLCIPAALLYHRRYAERQHRENIDHGLRDISIRLLTIPGLFVIATASVFVLLVPVAVLGGVVEAIGLASADLVVGSLYSLWLIPVAATFVLVLRALPWVNAIPHLLRDTLAYLSALARDYLPRESQTEGGGLRTKVPISGHSHTSVSIDEMAEVEMPGFYGYFPTTISDIELDEVASSRKTGLLLLVPGVTYYTVVYSYYQLFPEQFQRYAAYLPTVDILSVLVSFFGVPRFVLLEVFSRADFASEAVSFGFVAGVVPAALMIPAAWHLALEYEKLLYRFLQRLNSDHLLLLWAVHIIPVFPLVPLYWRLKAKIGR